MRHVAVLSALWFVLSGTAAAQSVELQWSAPRDCERSADVQAQLPARTSDAERAPLFVRAQITHAQTWRLSLTFPEGVEREFDAASCDELVDVAAIVLAMWLERAHETRPAGNDEPVPSPPTITAPQATDDETPAAPELESAMREADAAGDDAERAPVRWAARIEGELALGHVPTHAGGVRALGGVEGEHWNVEVGVRYLAPASVDVPGTERGSAQFWAISAIVSAGAAITPLDALRLELVAGLEAGAVSTSTTGLDVNTSTTIQLEAATLGVRARVRLHRNVGAYVAPDLCVPFRRTAFVVQGIGEVASIGPVGFSGRLGLEAVF